MNVLKFFLKCRRKSCNVQESKIKKIVGTMLSSDIGITNTAWKVSKYGVFSGLYFSVFGLNVGKYRPKETPYLDTFHAM